MRSTQKNKLTLQKKLRSSSTKTPPKGKEVASKSYVEAEKIKEPKVEKINDPKKSEIKKDISEIKTNVDVQPKEGTE